MNLGTWRAHAHLAGVREAVLDRLRRTIPRGMSSANAGGNGHEVRQRALRRSGASLHMIGSPPCTAPLPMQDVPGYLQVVCADQ